VDHEYTIEWGDDTVAEVFKRWFRVGDSYGIEAEPGEDVSFILAIAVCVDNRSRD
jgi:uncharacterized protein YxjI